MPDELVTPYNFVPFTPFVFEPGWGGQVSHDLPFSDGCSGSLFIEIETVTPLFIGAGKIRDATVDQPAEKARFSIGGTPAIPGTSLKGAIRNVLEIASLGRISSRMDDRTYSIRDLHNPKDYLRHMTERVDGAYAPKVKAGWLQLRGAGQWTLQPCKYSVVRQADLEAYFFKMHHRRISLGRRQEAEEKYKAISGLPLAIMFTPDVERPRDDWARGRRLSRADAIGTGSVSGRLVLTGQPQDRGRKDAKALEFLFHGEDMTPPLIVSDVVRQAFEDVHRDPNTREPTSLWKRWRVDLMKGERVPVFWLPEEDASDRIRAIGLTQMFRLAYRRSTLEMARQQGTGRDLADIMFGRVGEDRDDRALKGRVRFVDAICTKAGDPSDEQPVTMPMLAPKPSFYPAYVRQARYDRNDPARVPLAAGEEENWRQGVADYTTPMDPAAVIRGWKRYPVATRVRHREQPAKSTNTIMTRFTPVGRGTHFSGRIYVHNLRPAELGALAWALTFGDAEGRYCHSLGAARFAGYGVVRLRIVRADLEPANPASPRLDHSWLWQTAIPAFTATMEAAATGWERSRQLRSLLAMADPEAGDRAMKDGRLDEMSGPKLFQDIKGREVRRYLPLFDGQPDPDSVATVSLSGARPASGLPSRRPPPRPAAAPTTVQRRGMTKNGEVVDLLGAYGDEVEIRYVASGKIMWIPRDDMEDEE